MDNKKIQVGEYVRSSIHGIGKVYMIGPVRVNWTHQDTKTGGVQK